MDVWGPVIGEFVLLVVVAIMVVTGAFGFVEVTLSVLSTL